MKLENGEQNPFFHLNVEIIGSARASVASADSIGKMCALQFTAAPISSAASVAAIAWC